MKQSSIRIQEKQIFAAGKFRSLIARRSEASVCQVADDMERKRQIRKRFDIRQGSVGRCIVDDDHRRDEVVVVLCNAGDGFCESRTAVPVNENYIQLKFSVSRHLIFLPEEI